MKRGVRVEKTHWDSLRYENDTELSATFWGREEQPQFSASVLFSVPRRPCLVVHVWRYRLQIGWMP